MSSANAGVIRVPEDFATIQEAVDVANAHDTIKVGPGDYAGAYIVREPVIIQGSGPGTRITSANNHPLWPGEDAFDIFGRDAPPDYCPGLLECGADGTEIRDLVIEGDGSFFFGVYFLSHEVQVENVTIARTSWSIVGVGSDDTNLSNLEITECYQAMRLVSSSNAMITNPEITDCNVGVLFFFSNQLKVENGMIARTPWSIRGERSDDASIRNSLITDSYQGIASWGGNGWIVEDNTLIGVEMYPWPGSVKHADMILIVDGNDHIIRDNTLYHQGRAVCTGKPGSYCGPEDDERYAGIVLVAYTSTQPVEGNTVADNEVFILVKGKSIDGLSALVLLDYSLMGGGSALVQNNSVIDNVLIGGPGIEFAPPELSDLNLVRDNTTE
jgi:hypothetical protein